MKPGMKSILWSGVALLLILALAVPGINLLTMMLMMVPYVILYTTLSTRAFFLHLIPVWIIAAVIIGPSALLIAVFFVVPAIVMGRMYRKKLPASIVLVRTIIALLALFLLELLVLELVLGISLLKEMSTTVYAMMENVQQQQLLPETWDKDYTDSVIQMIMNSLPLTLIMVSFLYAVITHYIARRVLNAGGLELPGAPEAKDWKLPRVLVIYYLIIYVMGLFVSASSHSFFSVAVMNLLPLLQYAFAIQAVGFFFFIAHQRSWNKVVPILIAIPVLLFPPLSLIGVLDAAFPIRKSFKKP
ncbi:MAG: DUF2232 domain-containing protein [Candidatus Pristimantibacillus sp.]